MLYETAIALDNCTIACHDSSSRDCRKERQADVLITNIDITHVSFK